MKKEKQLKRTINGYTYVCEAIRGTKADAEKSRDIQKEYGGCLARVFPVSVEGQSFWGVFVSYKQIS